MDRDPRIDPRPGDKVNFAPWGEAEVLEVIPHLDGVSYRIPASPNPERLTTTLTVWRQSCLNGTVTVTHVTPEPPEEMVKTRDPRIDPRPGDRVCADHRGEMEVSEFDAVTAGVFYRYLNDTAHVRHGTPLTIWRMVCAKYLDAIVTHVAPDPPLARDPRIDPQVGDRVNLTKWGGAVEVLAGAKVDDECLVYRYTDNGQMVTTTLSAWRRICLNHTGVVTFVAPEPPEPVKETSAARDPRIDPRAGDKVLVPPWGEIEVTTYAAQEQLALVWYAARDGGHFANMNLQAWRQFCRTGTVTYVAPEPPPDDSKARERDFLLKLAALTRETGIAIAGCGDCDSPWITHLTPEEVSLEAGYAFIGGNGECPQWISPAHEYDWELYGDKIVK